MCWKRTCGHLAVLLLVSGACRTVTAQVAPTRSDPPVAELSDFYKQLIAALDEKIGRPFPNVRLRDLRTGKRLNLYDLQQQSVRVLYSETACPYTFVDAEYYRSRGWKEGNSPIVWIVESLPRRQKKKYRKRFGKDAPIYVVRDDESLGWLSDLDHSPVNYEIDLNRNQLCDWALHPDGAIETFGWDALKELDVPMPKSRLDSRLSCSVAAEVQGARNDE